MPDQKTDDDNRKGPRNPNMAVQKDAKAQPVNTGAKWRGNDKISDNNDHQESLPIMPTVRRP